MQAMKKLITILFVVSSMHAPSQSNDTLVRFVNPSAVVTPKGYSASVQVDLGTARMLLISGQVPLDKQGGLVGKGDFGKQVEQVFTNIQGIIQEAGGSIDNLVKINVYVTDMSQLQVFRDVRDKFVNRQHPPASTLVQVVKLFRDDVMVEIDATAVITKR